MAVEPRAPKRSPSASRQKERSTPSSIVASQSLSAPSQTSGAAGFVPAAASLQSPSFSTKPAGGKQAIIVAGAAASPNPSPSASVQNVRSTPSSTIASQSLSSRSQASGSRGW